MKFIANALGGKGIREIIRNYFVNDFYKEHCATYSGTIGKRPIYWLFDAGKNNSFKVLIYMHRYQPDTIARIRTDYVHEQQARYRTAIAIWNSAFPILLPVSVKMTAKSTRGRNKCHSSSVPEILLPSEL